MHDARKSKKSEKIMRGFMNKFHTFTLIAISSICLSSTISAFDKAKDILIAQFDNKPDADDIQAQAALGCILAHPDADGVNYYAVAGAYGKQGHPYTDSTSLFAMAFGTENVNWTDAHTNRAASVIRILNKVKPILEAGGKAWVQEAGQSDVTADWIKALLDAGVPATTVKNNVIVVQHSPWNENQTTPADLTYVKANATFQRLDDGNNEPGVGANRGPDTPRYRTEGSETHFLIDAMSNSNPNTFARNLWREADRIIIESGFKDDDPVWSPIPEGGVDYSDCVENWWILELGTKADSVEKFWARYVLNAPVGNLAPTASFESPLNGASYDEPASISLVEVNAADSDGSISNVKLYINDVFIRQENVFPYLWKPSQDSQLTNLAAGTYVLKAVATDNDGATKTVSISVTVKGEGTLPDNQVSSDIGNTGISTLAAFDNGSYLISASGKDIWGSADSFGFVNENASGDVEVTAQVESIENTNVWAKAGVMIRESLAANSKHAMIVITPSKGVSFQRRTATGGKSSHTTLAGIQAPEFVRVLRMGNAFSAYYSSDNNVWFPLNTVSIPMAANTHVGLAVTSHDNSQEAEALISNYSVKNPASNLSVVRFILVNADTNQDIREIHHNETVSKSADGSSLNIRAEVSGTTGSIVFDIDGGETRTESAAPYAANGDSKGNYYPWSPANGSHTILATPFSQSGGAGTAGSSLAIVINVVN